MRKGPSAPSSYVCRVKGSGAGRGRRAKTMGDFRSCRDLFFRMNCIYSKMDGARKVCSVGNWDVIVMKIG